MSRENIQLLWEACGARFPLILDIEQPDRQLVNSVKLDFPFATIGRTATNDIVLDHSQVSRRHAYLQVIDGQIFCVDLNSRTGTHREGSTGSGWVDHGQQLQIGPFTIRPQEFAHNESGFRSNLRSSNDPLHSFRSEQEPFSDFTIHFIKGVREQSSWQLRRVLALVGSSPHCKLQLVDPRVSRYHCSLLRTSLGTWVIDLKGRGGLRVNGARVRFARLYDGDELQVGIVKIRIECDTQRSPAVVHDQPLTYPTGDFIDVGESISRISLGSQTDPLASKLDSDQVLASPMSTIQPGLTFKPPLAPPHSNANLMTAQRLPSVPSLVDQENLISTLLYHFGQMQQQMAEQFNQAVMTMVQMFSTFHRDQMDLVREELNRLHDLNQEIVAIQTEMAMQHPPRVPQATPAKVPLVTTQLTSTFLLGNMPYSRDSNEDGPSAPLGSGADRGVGSEDELAGHTVGLETFARNQRRAQNKREEMCEASPSESVTDRESSGPRPGDDSRQKVGTSQGYGIDPNRPSGEDAHAWLWQRMETIRAEQQTLWQKILTTVRAKVTGNPSE